MHTEKIIYQTHGINCHGFVAYDSTIKTSRPLVLVAHAWRGQDAFARNKACELAQLGYVGFAVDLYGEGKEVTSSEDALALMKPLFLDRNELQARMKAALAYGKTLPSVDAVRTGAIGFCFGGLAALELYRSGAPLSGAVTFHAVLGNTLDTTLASTVPIARHIPGSLLILHGHDDPLVSAEDIKAIEDELTKAKADWQLHIYSKTSHAFTVPDAHDPKMGLQYNEVAAKRSWQSMKNFFAEIFHCNR